MNPQLFLITRLQCFISLFLFPSFLFLFSCLLWACTLVVRMSVFQCKAPTHVLRRFSVSQIFRYLCLLISSVMRLLWSKSGWTSGFPKLSVKQLHCSESKTQPQINGHHPSEGLFHAQVSHHTASSLEAQHLTVQNYFLSLRMCLLNFTYQAPFDEKID